MLYSSLYDLLNSLSCGTKLQLGVIFLGNVRCEQLILPVKSTIHTAAVCSRIKSDPANVRRCISCRDLAIRRALRTGEPFGGICAGGLYEYTHPIISEGKVIGIIFIGNILDEARGGSRLRRSLAACGSEELLETVEADFDPGRCGVFARLIDSYIHLLLEKPTLEVPLSAKSTLIHDLIAFVDENIANGVDYRMLAEVFHYNEKYLGRIFKQETGLSIRVYICRRRIERAAYLLKTGDEDVVDIAFRVGFNNLSYFGRRFLEFTGMTPTEYRQRCREDLDGKVERGASLVW